MTSLVLLGKKPSAEFVSEIERGLAPCLEYLELASALGAEVMAFDDAASRFKGPIANLLSNDQLLGSSIAAFLRRSEFSTIYATGEDIALRIAPLLRLSRWRGQLITVVHACISSRRKMYFRQLGPRSFGDLVCVCNEQRRILIEEAKFPPSMVHFIHNWVDVNFFSPGEDSGPTESPDYIFSCGLERRDYGTLALAATKLPYLFRIAASGFRGDGLGGEAAPTPNMSVLDGKVPYAELRRLYANCRFVVVPLHAIPYAAGVTGVLEAMAMGKAVIASGSPGIADYVADGVTGRVVPPGDPDALAAAISDLWNAPEVCNRIGQRNRAWVQANASVEGYVRQIGDLIPRQSDRLAS